MPHRYPDSSVFYRHLKKTFPKIVSGRGVRLLDDTGKSYLDASSGAYVVSIGHGIAELADEMRAQIASFAYVNGTQFTHAPVEELAEELRQVLPASLRYSYFLSSGSEAVEAAIKLARQYFFERGEKNRWKIISRKPSYHGNTLAALSLSGREHYREIYGPMLTTYPRITAPDPYRQAPNDRALTGEALEDELLAQDPRTVAAFIAEPIGGSTTGATVPPHDYFKTVRDICKRYGILFIADEVLTGIGRTGRWFAFEHFGVQPDIMTLGKGLNGGLAPLSAVIADTFVVDTIAERSGVFNHAQTYSHTPVACAAGRAAMRYIKRNKLVERAHNLEPHLFQQLEKLKRHSIVGDIRGRGLLAGIELVEDRNSKRPFARTRRLAEEIAARAMDDGLVVWTNTGHVDGTDGDIVLLAPPLVITTEEIDEIVVKLDRVLETVS